MSFPHGVLKAAEHAKEFAKAGGTVADYRIKHKNEWRVLEGENLLMRIFRPKAPKRVRPIMTPTRIDPKPTTPQLWFTPLLDLGGKSMNSAFR